MKFINFKKENKGYGLLELIFYIAIFSITAILVVNSIMTMVGAYKETSSNNHLIQSSKILERISREIRNSEIYSINGDSITLTDKDSSTVTFTLSGGDISVYESGVLVGILNSSNLVVSDISFTPIISVRNGAAYDAMAVVPLRSLGVKVSITMQSNRFGLLKEKTFYTSVVLRESY